VANAGSGVVNVYDGSTGLFAKVSRSAKKLIRTTFDIDDATKQVLFGIVGGIGVNRRRTETRVGKDLKGSGGHLRVFPTEKKGSRVFVNVPEDNSIVNVIDRKTGELTKWELNGIKANYPMALDETIIGSLSLPGRPPLVVVLNTDTGKEVARVALEDHATTYFDAERKRIYALGGEGFISAIQQNDPAHYTLIANIRPP